MAHLRCLRDWAGSPAIPATPCRDLAIATGTLLEIGRGRHRRGWMLRCVAGPPPNRRPPDFAAAVSGQQPLPNRVAGTSTDPVRIVAERVVWAAMLVPAATIQPGQLPNDSNWATSPAELGGGTDRTLGSIPKDVTRNNALVQAAGRI